MQTGKVYAEQLQIHYRRWGNGPHLVLALHGYGETGELFSQLVKELDGNTFSLIAIDLPLHGESEWNGDEAIDPALLAGLLAEMIQESGNYTRKTLMGYSMGGRLALSMYSHEPSLFTDLFLMAPDGLTVNFWYWLATQTILGRKLFYSVMRNANSFKQLLLLAAKMKLVNQSIVKFVRHYIDDPAIRKDIYSRWLAFRRFRCNPIRLKAALTQFGTQVQLVYGKYDRIILPDKGKQWAELFPNQIRLHLLTSGHKIITPSHASLLVKLLKHDG